MKTGNRKFYSFLVTVLLYTFVVMAALLKGNSVGDMAVFALQVSMGFCGISGLFFGSNVLEHFAQAKEK